MSQGDRQGLTRIPRHTATRKVTRALQLLCGFGSLLPDNCWLTLLSSRHRHTRHTPAHRAHKHTNEHARAHVRPQAHANVLVGRKEVTEQVVADEEDLGLPLETAMPGFIASPSCPLAV